eukprot:Colp12_sorted_trinity150504_noHs@3638
MIHSTFALFVAAQESSVLHGLACKLWQCVWDTDDSEALHTVIVEARLLHLLQATFTTSQRKTSCTAHISLVANQVLRHVGEEAEGHPNLAALLSSNKPILDFLNSLRSENYSERRESATEVRVLPAELVAKVQSLAFAEDSPIFRAMAFAANAVASANNAQ